MAAVDPVVLIIEDEPQMRRFLRATLRAHDYQVVEAATAREGLMQAAGRRFGTVSGSARTLRSWEWSRDTIP